MNTKTLITLAIALAGFATATTSMAGEATYELPLPATSLLTRAEVRAELAAARAAGQLDLGERSFVAAPTGMAKTRAQVVAETLEAIRIGALNHGEKNTVLTDAQIERIEMAGLRALPMTVAAR
jgi:hypothetical protein